MKLNLSTPATKITVKRPLGRFPPGWVVLWWCILVVLFVEVVAVHGTVVKGASTDETELPSPEEEVEAKWDSKLRNTRSKRAAANAYPRIRHEARRAKQQQQQQQRHGRHRRLDDEGEVPQWITKKTSNSLQIPQGRAADDDVYPEYYHNTKLADSSAGGGGGTWDAAGAHHDTIDFERKEDDLEKTANFIDFSIGTPDFSIGTPGSQNRGGNNNDNNNSRGGPPSDWGGGHHSDHSVGSAQWELTRMKDYLAIADVTHDKVPLGIENGAPDFSCFLASNGNVGLGTSYPTAKLHLVGDAPSIRLEERDARNSQYNSGQTWDIAANNGGFFLYQESRNQRLLPFMIASSAKSMSLVVDKYGNVGMGTDSPTAKLHVMGSVRIEDTLNVGPCTLDTRTCSWKRYRRRRLLRRKSPEDENEAGFLDLDQGDVGEEEDEVSQGDEDEEELVAYLESLEQKHERALDRIKTTESRLEQLEAAFVKEQEENTWRSERLAALEAKVALLQNEEDEQQQEQQQERNAES
ncbi:hypothetical protein ACA910_017323 [Epithemia clementina (nom. ined.)]